MNKLYYGDCLDVLRTLPAESVDLIYLDPPFNSNREYNAIFSSPLREKTVATAQIVAFNDTWHWGKQSQDEYEALLCNPNAGVLGEKLIDALYAFLGNSNMMAYLVMMASRLVELKRVLKDTGSIFLHCDSTASHYLGILLDGLFGKDNFQNEIVWRRSNAHNNAKKRLARVHDTILFYTKSDSASFYSPYTAYNEEYLKKFYKYKDEDGRRYQLGDLTCPTENRPNLKYEFLGITRVWRWTKERMQKAYEEGRVVQKKPGNVPLCKRYLDEMPGQLLTDCWDDIKPLSGTHKERLGYPTQKPVALLERIIKLASNPGDVVLDPFCGCGTAVYTAEKLGRQWIGIDITHLAIALIRQRMNNAFPNCEFSVEGTPKDVASARYLAENNGLNGRYQFQYWALSLVNAMPSQDKKKGADSGIDGYIWAHDEPTMKKPYKIAISVKSGKIPANHIREMQGLLHDKTKMAFLITLEEPSRKMEADAVAAGEYEHPNGKKSQCIQIFTIESLLNGAKPDYLDYSLGKTTTKQAQEEPKSLPQGKFGK